MNTDGRIQGLQTRMIHRANSAVEDIIADLDNALQSA